jgi:hypothetical protein
MAVHRLAFSRPVLEAIQHGTITCALRRELVVVPGDIVLAGLDGQPPLLKLKVTGFRRGVPFLGLSRRDFERAGIRDPQSRASLLAQLDSGPNPSINLIHFRIMKS